ncbi:DUF935 domain-containing protein [Agarivorans gilvus]|uniref:DUF935 domain-containing protein n=1 Tax=Agarivorans gilvus TaxID=680279 RepID=A0ABQ1HZY8_9ALTE|nr:DUF935 domain-containing protein [Agarivorans gilvus]GGA95841.1 hypothetical protein GCM10007414_05850 [Agarivorans gilvus]
MAIVDIHGKPIRQQQLKQNQTDQAELSHLRTHFAEHPSSGLTPSRLAEIMQAAEQGDLIAQCELAEDIEEKDAHIFAELQKRRRALLGPDWQITPPRKASEQEKQDCALLQEWLEDVLDLEQVITDMSDAILKGFANSEIIWTRSDGLWLPQFIEYRDPSWFQTHPEQRNQLRLRDNSYHGAALQAFGWLSHTHQAKSGYVGRGGLVRQLAWPFIFKNYSVRDLAEFLEIYGLPLRLGKYPSGASEPEKRTLLNAVMSIGHNAGGIIPQGMQIDFQEAAKGQSDPFEVMTNWAERSASKAILGGTLTSQADGKSSTNALGNVHNEVRQELRDADCKQIARTLTQQLVFPIYQLNCKSYRHPRRIPQFEFDLTEPEDLKLYSEAIPALVQTGMKIPSQWVHDKLQIPQAKDGEEVLGMVKAQPPAGQAELAALSASTPTQGDELDNMQAQLSANSAPLLNNLIAPVRQLVSEATSLEQIRDGILELAGELDVEELGTQMAQAFAAAELLGQLEIEEGR